VIFRTKDDTVDEESQATVMCSRVQTHLRCGHIRRSPMDYCNRSTRNPVTGRKNKCSRATSTYTRQSDALCGNEDDCCLSAWHGRWICCTCKHGYRPREVNRNVYCTVGSCGHQVCWGCRPRTEQNIRTMYAIESGSSEEIEDATGEDISEDTIVFSEPDDGNGDQ
jgi:hypothetical protein